MSYRSKYLDKVESRNGRRSFLKSLAAAPVAGSITVPEVTKSFEPESSESLHAKTSHAIRAKEPRGLRIRSGVPCTATSFYTCGPLSTWPIDEDGWHEDTYK